MKVDLDSDVQDILDYLCPKMLRCRKCRHSLVDPVRKGNFHYCRTCAKPPTRKAEPTLFETHCRWVFFSTKQHQELTCHVCTRFLLEPVALNCCANKICAGCLRRVESCPFCRHPLFKKSPIDRCLVQMMQLYFDQTRYQKLMSLLQKESRQAEQRRVKAKQYLESNRLGYLIDVLEGICKHSLEWYLECDQVKTTLGERSESPLCESEFRLVLRNSSLIGKSWVRAGGLLLRCRLNLPKLIEQNPELPFQQLQSMWIAVTVAELLNKEVDLELARVWLSNNQCSGWILDQMGQRIEWLDEEPLEGEELLLAIEEFQDL